MRRRRQIRNKAHFAPVVVMFSLALLIGVVVYAFSQDSSTMNNGVNLASNSVKIVETTSEGFGSKTVSFRNDGANNPDVLLRIAYSEMWTKSDGSIVSNTVGGNNVVTKTWAADFTSDFVDGGDGWYYYGKVLSADTEVDVLSAIALNDDSYAKYNYDLSFHFESVQADAAAANSLWGRNATINDDGSVAWEI